MIVRDRPSGLRLFLVWRGSVIMRIRRVLAVNIILAAAVTWAHGDVFDHKVTLTTIPFTLIGLPLAIFLGFRNSAAYDRYWEGRKLWGSLVSLSRSLARQCLSLIDDADDGEPQPQRLDDLRIRMICRTIAFCQALKHQLRGTPDPNCEVSSLLRSEEWQRVAAARNRLTTLMQAMAADLQQARRQGRVDSIRAVAIDATLAELTAAATACERIRNTPLPFSYTLLLHRTAYLYCFLLPFGLVDSIGYMTPFVVAIVAYTFFGLDALGDEIEEPFGLLPNDLPLDAICRTIEIDLREAIGDSALPPPLQPSDFCLM